MHLPANVVDSPQLRDRSYVFVDRQDGGEALARLLEPYRGKDGVVLAIPAGGVAVARPIAERLALSFDLAVVSKITLPWSTEAGYGAVAFDGSVGLNEHLIRRLELDEGTVAEGIARTRAKVEQRTHNLRSDRPLPPLGGRPCLLVDDGLASGFTMRVALEAIRRAGATELVVAVPTGHLDTVVTLAAGVKRLACANIRGGPTFAVADAYRNWYDVSDAELARLLGFAG